MRDGRSFHPHAWEQTTRRDPRAVFGSDDRARLSDDPDLSPYLEITQEQVAGLLWACGEYFGRAFGDMPPPGFGDVAPDAEAIEAHRALRRAYAACCVHDDDSPTPRADDVVFDADEQHELSYFKWVRGAERITRKQLTRLLAALDRYATRATLIHVAPPVSIVSRMLHGHNTLVCFRDQPVTFEEFGRQLRDLMARVD
jgi:hypothetical protein